MLFIIQNAWADELESLKKLVSLTADIKTWDTIINNQVGFNDLSDNSETFTNLDNHDMNHSELYSKLDHKMYCLQCTYALYAKNHLYSIHSHIVDKFLVFDVITSHLSKLKLLYLDVALKTVATMTQLSYMQLPDWMLQLIKYLKTEESDEQTFHPNMANILKTLNKVTSQPDCNPRNLPSLSPELSNDGLQSTVLENAPWEQLKHQINEVDMDNDIKKFIIQNNLTNNVLGDYENKSTGIKKETNNIKPQDIYIFKQFKKAELEILKNVLEVTYLLYLNKSILSYDNYKTVNLLKYEKTAKTEVETDNNYKKIQYVRTGLSEQDQIIQEAEQLHNKFLLLSKINLWVPLQLEENDRLLIEEKLNVGDFNIYKEKINSLKINNNKIINRLECTYLFYTKQHLIIIDDTLKKIKEPKIPNKLMELIIAYFDVSMKMFASIYNITDKTILTWNVEIFLYYRKIPKLSKDLNTFITENSKMLNVLNNPCDLCREFEGPFPVFEVQRQTIQNSLEYSKEHNYLKNLQLELSVLNLNKFSDEIYLSNFYNNLIEVLNLLNLNENYLDYY